MKAKIGDWVRFLQNNTFVIGKVEYLGRKHDTMGARYHTDVGSVFDEYVLEVRSADAQATVEALQRERDEARDFLNTVTNDLNEQAGELSQLQALVRVYKEAVDYYAKTAVCARAVAALEKAATLDAMTPAKGQELEDK